MATTGSVKAKIQGLIEKSNATTGKTDTDLTTAVDALIEQAGKGAELNIAYGDTAPEDTTKLWVKTSEPSGVIVSPDMVEQESGEISLNTLAEVLPQNMSDMGCATVGDYIYIFGGSVGSSYFNTIYKFDTKTETLINLTTQLPTRLGNMACAAVGTKIYLLGGMSASGDQKKIYRFDTDTEKITELSALPNTLWAIGCTCIKTKIYLFGGVASGYSNAIYCYDTETNEVTKMTATLSKGTYYPSCVAVGDKIYILGGYQRYGAISCYDTYTDTIHDLTAKIPESIEGAGACAFGTKIYVLSGKYGTNVYCLDTETEELTTLPQTFSSYVYECGCAAWENKVYLFGGINPNGQRINTIYRFTTAGMVKLLPENQLQIIPVLYNRFLLVNTESLKVDIGVHEVYKGNTDGFGEQVEAALYKDGAWTTI